MIFRLYALVLVLLLAGLGCLHQGRSQTLPLLGAGKGAVGTAPSFSGPGDIVGGALAYFGGQAYTAAYATGLNKAFNVCLALDATCGDLSFGADGAVVNTAVGGALCSAVTCTIKTAYDQTGNGNDVINATIATRPTIQFSCQGARACMVFASGQFLVLGPWHGGTDLNQPWTLSSAFIDTGTNMAVGGAVIAATGSGLVAGLYTDGSGNAVTCYAGGSGLTASFTFNNWGAITAVANGASSDINVNGTANIGDCGARVFDGNQLFLGNDNGGSLLVGKIGTAGIWNSAFSGANSSAISANSHTFWGF